MKILVYSETKGSDIKARLGRAEYSYYFIYAKYKPVLEKLGTLVEISDPATEVDAIYAAQSGGDCVFLSFTPPHRTAQNLRCPTVCVFAWEFSSIPSDTWDSPSEFDWVGALNRIGYALAISNYSIAVASDVVAQHVKLAAVPAPVSAPSGWRTKAKSFDQSVSLSAVLYDSRELAVFATAGSGRAAPTEAAPMWDDAPLEVAFVESNTEAGKMLAGFYAVEEWGVWSRTSTPQIVLPIRIAGPVCIELELIGHGANVGREIELGVGQASSTLVLAEHPQRYTLDLNLTAAEQVLSFSGLDLAKAPGRDNRTLGIGLKALSVKRPPGYRAPIVTRVKKRVMQFFNAGRGELQSTKTAQLSLEGVVYTSVLNPEDGRKNWEDMVSAFCLAFRDTEDATLLLKMTNHNVSTFLGTLKLLFATLPAFKCRVVAIHGYLSDEELQALAECSHFVVNSSLCEGQCLPLMEYMAQGVPAIAPDHTAMADYINSDNAFIVASSLQPAYWPFDERRSLRTLRYRIDWSSLRDAFLESYRTVKEEGDRYEGMRNASIATIARVAGPDVVYRTLDTFLHNALEASGR